MAILVRLNIKHLSVYPSIQTFRLWYTYIDRYEKRISNVNILEIVEQNSLYKRLYRLWVSWFICEAKGLRSQKETIYLFIHKSVHVFYRVKRALYCYWIKFLVYTEVEILLEYFWDCWSYKYSLRISNLVGVYFKFGNSWLNLMEGVMKKNTGKENMSKILQIPG